MFKVYLICKLEVLFDLFIIFYNPLHKYCQLIYCQEFYFYVFAVFFHLIRQMEVQILKGFCFYSIWFGPFRWLILFYERYTYYLLLVLFTLRCSVFFLFRFNHVLSRFLYLTVKCLPFLPVFFKFYKTISPNIFDFTVTLLVVNKPIFYGSSPNRSCIPSSCWYVPSPLTLTVVSSVNPS